jgi:HK97 gp10 family phage protein
MEMTADSKALLKVFESLPRALELKLLRFVMRKGASVVKRHAENNIRSLVSSEATHTLEKSIEVKKLKNLNGKMRYAVRIKPKSINQTKLDGNGKPVRVGLYGAVLEYGKKNQPPRAWLRNAMRENVQEVLTETQETFKNGINAAVIQAGGK